MMSMVFQRWCVAGLILLGSGRIIAQSAPLRPAMLDRGTITAARERIAAHDQALMPAYERLLERADKLLAENKIPAVTDKAGTPPSGDKHDYVSFAVYYWPNPDTPDGLPWVYRDGQFNMQEIARWDALSLSHASWMVRATTIAYALTGRDEYAARAAHVLKTWFVDPKTRMSPHLRFGQFIPGRAEGTCSGIIETRELGLSMLDSACLLQGSGHWSADDQAALCAWANDYLDWLLTSDFGKREAATGNNHAVWYDVQVVWLAAFVGRTDLAMQVCRDFGAKRLAVQIAPDGSLPAELARTRSLHYSIFTLEGAYYVSHIGRRLGVDVYGYKTEDGRGLQKAIDYVLPALTGENPWPHKDIAPEDLDTLVLRPLLREAADVYHDARYSLAATRLNNTRNPSPVRLDNLVITVTGP